MNSARIKIPITFPTPPSPHFDDETTIVSARRVVPIARAKMLERLRMLLVALPVLLASGLFGAIGAIGLNHYVNRQPAPPSTESQVQASQKSQADQPKAPQSQTAGTAVSEPAESVTTGLSEPASHRKPSSRPQVEAQVAEQQNKSIADQANTPGAAAAEAARLATTTQPVSSPAKDYGNSPGSSGPDPTRLVRKRRVFQASERNGTAISKKEKPTNRKRRGVGHVQELGEVSNP